MCRQLVVDSWEANRDLYIHTKISKCSEGWLFGGRKSQAVSREKYSTGKKIIRGLKGRTYAISCRRFYEANSKLHEVLA